MAVSSDKITQIVTAITNKIMSLISAHDADNSAHSTLFSGKADSSHSHGLISSGGKIGSTANKPLITTNNGGITTGSFGNSANTFCEGNDSRLSDARTPTSHNQASSTITDTNTYSNINNSAQTQESINDAVNTKLGYLNVDVFEVVNSLGTASASTTNKLYLIKSASGLDDNYDTYITVKNGSTYSWEKIDTTSLSISVDPSLYVKYSDVVDNLNSTSTTTPLSANQGKQLNTLIENAIGDLGGKKLYDDCSSDKTSNYNSVQIDNRGVVSSMTFNTDHYVLSSSKDCFSGFELSDEVDNIEISVEFKASSTSNFCQAHLGYFNGTESKTIRNVGKKIGTWTKTYSGSDSGTDIYTNSSYLTSEYWRFKLQRKGNNIRFSFENLSGTELAYSNQTITSSQSGKFFVGFLSGSSRDVYIRNIKVKEIKYSTSEIDNLLSNKADSNHTHDDRYYTESEVDTLISNLTTWETVYNKNDIVMKVNTATHEVQVTFNRTVNITTVNSDIGVVSDLPVAYKPPSDLFVKSHEYDAFTKITYVSGGENKLKMFVRASSTGNKTFRAYFNYHYE